MSASKYGRSCLTLILLMCNKSTALQSVTVYVFITSSMLFPKKRLLEILCAGQLENVPQTVVKAPRMTHIEGLDYDH